MSIRGEDFYINDQITLKDKTYNGMRLEGLLPNSRMVQGTFDDSNSATRTNWNYADTGAWNADGYQSVPVDWGIQSERKRAFFGLLKKMVQ